MVFTWLAQSPVDSLPADWQSRLLLIGVRLFLAAVFGIMVAIAYRLKRGKDQAIPTFSLTLVLLALLIAMVTQVIGNQIALAFSLVGALSIVRFRTVVEDTQDIAFVIFAVVDGMAIGTGNFTVAVLGSVITLSVIALASFTERRSKPARERAEVTVRTAVPGSSEGLTQPVFQRFFSEYKLLSAETVRGGSAFDWKFAVVFLDSASPMEMMEALNRVEGIQNVDLKMKNGNNS